MAGTFCANAVDSAETDSDFRILEWQQLANESAMKQELMLQPKMTREGVVGTAATDVRAAVKVATNRPIRAAGSRKGSWMERVLEEEQQKPLKVSEQFVRKFEQREAAAKERSQLEQCRFRKNVKKIESTRKRNEHQRKLTAAARDERRKFELQESSRVTGVVFDENNVEGSGQKEADQFYEADEDDQWRDDIPPQEDNQNSNIHSWSSKSPTGENAPTPSAARENRAPEIQFVKRHTPATGNTPSQIIYAVKVAPGLATAVQHKVQDSAPPALGKRSQQLRNTVKRESQCDIELRAARVARQEKRREQEQRAVYQDSVIKQWMLEKSVIERHRKANIDGVRRRERGRMLEDRARIMTMEAHIRPPNPERPKSTEPGARSNTGMSTSSYLQRQRQLLLEDYLRKHMSLPLQSRSTVLAGLQEIQPRRAASADPLVGGRSGLDVQALG